jgi:hypothetical protein
MIVFSGWGIVLVPLFGIIGFSISMALRILTWGSGKVDLSPVQPLSSIYFAVGGLVAGGLCWSAGRKLNFKRVLIDKVTGEEITLGSRHSLMLIPIEYYVMIYPVLFVWFGPSL